MIRRCDEDQCEAILEVINDAASAYQGIIPPDRWNDPYMPESELGHEIEAGVVFWGYYEDGQLVGVMGVQDVQDVTLIRHAYVRTERRREGIGHQLLDRLRAESTRPYLIGTWAAATWAIRFYEKHGFRLLSREETVRVLHKYWSIPDRQVETAVVLADDRWNKPGVVVEPFGRLERSVDGGSRRSVTSLDRNGVDVGLLTNTAVRTASPVR